jgi:possible N-acetylmuramoyl-L-alanine amidase|nr:MAG TPA: N-acetylmuramoyl-L-alanine amidase [Caudoviricetes sp.]
MSYEYITRFNSPNYNVGNTPIRRIIVHHWGADGQNFNAVVGWLCNPRSGVSAHYVLEAGKVACLVDENKIAWHAYKNNRGSIGIECRPECTSGDVDTLVELIANIYKHVGGVIPVIGHKDVNRTACPGRYYDKLSDIKRRATELYMTGNLPSANYSSGSSASSTSGKLTEDGLFGQQSVMAMQHWLGGKYRDGVMSGQLRKCSAYISNMKYGVKYGLFGSYTVKLLQKVVGVTADGYLGYDTICGLQKYLNGKGYSLTVDGYAGYNTCKAFQNYLNKVL